MARHNGTQINRVPSNRLPAKRRVKRNSGLVTRPWRIRKNSLWNPDSGEVQFSDQCLRTLWVETGHTAATCQQAAVSPVETALKELIGGWTENFKGAGRAAVHVYLTSCLTSHMVRWSRDKK